MRRNNNALSLAKPRPRWGSVGGLPARYGKFDPGQAAGHVETPGGKPVTYLHYNLQRRLCPGPKEEAVPLSMYVQWNFLALKPIN